MKKLIDISVPLENGMVAWPGSVGYSLVQTMKMVDGAHANNSRLDTDVHVGTHIDAPWHSIPDGMTIEKLDLGDLVGKAYVANISGVSTVTASVLEEAGIPDEAERLLIKTTNSIYWKSGSREFHEDFVGLVPDASEWICRRRMRLVGLDYLSIQAFSQKTMATHNILLEKNIIIVEGLNLADVMPGFYELLCLPIKLVGAEGSPARAVLRPLF
jgi:arylformamidase